uniref:C2H2-type domain-containing protein n=1 Tax=Astatotilapia calliptera TaxID=8154 RepID=A0A3P8R3X6_ASTCA
MDGGVSELPGPSLPLSALRLLVSPIRLVSAAIWQTVEQKVVSDYGLLEEFVFMVTEIVPQLLSTRQRAELVLGLRARLILELCRSDDTADLQVIQPHLDRMQKLRSLWSVENAEPVSDSHFMGLVQNLLRDPEERRNFFIDVFPGDFGPTYDKAIQTLMWLFLSRLEKLLPTKTLQQPLFHQIASLLNDTSSVLNECIGAFSQPQELKVLLDNQKDLTQLEDIESFIVDSGILSALCLPPVERVVIVNEQTETDAESSLVYTVCTEMEVESENKEVYVEGTGNSEECVQPEWFGLTGEVKPEIDAVVVMDTVEGTEASESEMAEDRNDNQSGTLIIGEDGQVTVLDGVEKKPNRRGRKKKRPVDEDFEAESAVAGKKETPESDALLERSVRKNRGLKMKRYLSQWRKSGKTPGSSTTSSGPKKFAGPQGPAKSNDLDERTCKVCSKVVSHAKFLQRHMSQHSEELPITCPSCKKLYKSLRSLQQHRCASMTKAKAVRKAKEQDTPADEGEQSSSGVPCDDTNEEQPVDNTTQDPDYSPPAERASKEPGQKSPEEQKSVLEGPFYCPHCSVEFKCKQTFRFHLRNICYNEQQVDPEKPDDVKHCFRCDECDKAFRYKSTLDSHKQTHNPLYCEVCMKLVRDSEALAMHKESHTPFQCNRCEENFPVFKALHKHYIDVHNPTEPFTCSHCQTTFASLKRFIRHEWKHTGYQPFQCSHCSKRFRSYSDLVEHQKKHTKAYPFLCWECGKKFRHGITLTRHVERVHHSGEPVTEKPTPIFTCPQCGKTFTSRRCLLKHDNFHHKGLRFPCEHCGKGFFGKDALVRHTLIHTGERPFKCDDCDKSFRSAAELKIHRRYHTGERPFKCNICEKGFVQSCFLTLHMRTHTGERPYVCAVCNKGFSSLHGLKRHRRLVHA